MMPLDPDARARRAARHTGSPALWQPQPGIASEGFATFLKAAVENKDLQAIRRVELKLCIRMPSFERDILVPIVEQR